MLLQMGSGSGRRGSGLADDDGSDDWWLIVLLLLSGEDGDAFIMTMLSFNRKYLVGTIPVAAAIHAVEWRQRLKKVPKRTTQKVR